MIYKNFNLATQKQIESQNELDCIKASLLEIYEGEITNIAKKYKFKMPPSAAEINSSPLVLLLGNHSR